MMPPSLSNGGEVAMGNRMARRSLEFSGVLKDFLTMGLFQEMHNNTKLKLYLSEGALIKVSVCDVSKIPPYAQVTYRGGLIHSV